MAVEFGRGDQIAGRRHLELAFEELRCGRMPNCDEDAIGGPFRAFSGFQIPELDASDRFRRRRADDIFDNGVPDHVDLRILQQSLLQDFLGTQRIAAVDQRHAIGEVRQKQRLFDSRVAAADDDDLFTLVEKAVARCAGRNAVAFEKVFRMEA